MLILCLFKNLLSSSAFYICPFLLVFHVIQVDKSLMLYEANSSLSNILGDANKYLLLMGLMTKSIDGRVSNFHSALKLALTFSFLIL